MLIDIFKMMKNHIKDHCTMDINKSCEYLTKKLLKKKRAVNKLNIFNGEEIGNIISVTLPSSRKKENLWYKTLFIIEISYLIIFIDLPVSME